MPIGTVFESTLERTVVADGGDTFCLQKQAFFVQGNRLLQDLIPAWVDVI